MSPRAQAHPLDLGYLQLNQTDTGKIEASFELNPKAAEHFSGLPELTQATFSPENSSRIFESTLEKSEITEDGTKCLWEKGRSDWINDQQIRVTGLASCPKAEKGSLTLSLLFLKSASTTYQVLGRMTSDSQEKSFVADPKNIEVQIQNLNSSHSLFEFIGMGIKHIGAWPSEWYSAEGYHLPDGIDHILFLLALILAGGGLINILKTATGFTVGHSVTLAIASLGLVHLPSRFVESMIALSIVYVAIEALIIRQSKHKWKVAAGFGLVHGFGFASALAELKLNSSQMMKALFGFNFGVETGQALIIVSVLPFLLLLGTKPELSRRTVQCCSGMIAIAGTYWFYLRAFG
jgi:hypothetical protein